MKARWIDARPCIACLRMRDAHVRFTNGSAGQSTLADTRYVFQVHRFFATGIVLWSFLARRHAPPAAFATASYHRLSHAPINCAAVGAASTRRAQSASLICSYPDVSLRVIAASGAPQADHKMAPNHGARSWRVVSIIRQWARAESLFACAKHHHAERGHRRSVEACEHDTSPRVARSRAKATHGA